MKSNEALAEAWASLSGKAEKFRQCKADPALDDTQGYYHGYLCAADELARRLNKRGYVIVSKVTLGLLSGVTLAFIVDVLLRVLA